MISDKNTKNASWAISLELGNRTMASLFEERIDTMAVIRTRCRRARHVERRA